VISEQVQVALVFGFASIVPTVFGFINGIRLDRLKRKIDRVHADVNGKMNDLLRINGEAERAKGNLEGREELKSEQG
jgi:hypothetical protein